MAGIYLHIPFCYKQCDYCDFFKTTNITLKNEFLKVLEKEISKNEKFIENEDIETIYFGGGTPSILTGIEVDKILTLIISKIKNKNNLKEITFELNPDDGFPGYLDKLKETGINRLSIGIQSFDERLLKLLNRRHNAEQAKNVVINAGKAGFENISIDLMYGLPELNMDTWRKTIDDALMLHVEHISAYHLTYEPGTVFGDKLKRGIFRETGEEESVEQFRLLMDKLTSAGYEHYEISNFSLPGKMSLHNSSYWHGKKYIGFGPSAHSFDGSKRWWNVSDMNRYLKGDLVEKEEVLTETDKFNELIMLKLRISEGVSDHELKRAGEKYRKFFMEKVKEFISSGNIKYQNERYFITRKGIFISDYIISELFYSE